MTDRKPLVIALAVIMPILATTAVVLRLVSRRIKKVRLEADDYTVLIALLFASVSCAGLLPSVFIGNLGGHTPARPNGLYLPTPRQIIALQTTFWVIQFATITGCGLAKLSVLLFYRRIFCNGTSAGKFRTITQILIGLISLWTLAFFLATFFICWPISENWSLTQSRDDKCADRKSLFWAANITDILTDIVILTLPWYQVWKLKMPLKQRLTVGALFLLGGFVICAGITRTVIQLQLTYAPLGSVETSYAVALALCWGSIEVCIGVVSACLPTLRPLLSPSGLESIIRSFRSRVLGSWQKSTPWDSDQTDLNSRPRYHTHETPTSGSSLVDSAYQGEKYARHSTPKGLSRLAHVRMYDV